jgi:hypothetical protein
MENGSREKSFSSNLRRDEGFSEKCCANGHRGAQRAR